MAGLTVTGSSLNHTENKKSHNTLKFSSEKLIVRRGHPLKLNLSCNKAIQTSDRMEFTVTLKTATQGTPLLNTKFVASTNEDKTSWSAQRVSSDSTNSATMAIHPPPDARIGCYSMTVNTTGGIHNIGDFILLCNPWCPEDSVYMSDSAKRTVYHDMTYTLMFRNISKKSSPFVWDCGQWDSDILEICLTLFDRSIDFQRDPNADVAERGNPIHFCRVLSAMVNANDDNGVVYGNWSNNYADGKSPGSWNGSAPILKQWKQQNYKPVRYGQCWVFAGVLTTVLRCLGICSRVITNFNSGHDTDMNLTIETYKNSEGQDLFYSADSIWNYHCWNEAWFKRPDLGPEHNVWQILDATPQEESDGLFCCGPTSQKAVKEGLVNLKYDAYFVYSEVSADTQTLYVNEDNQVIKTYTNTRSVGLLTCTMSMDEKSREDITLEYKYLEGSQKEREVHRNALAIVKKFQGYRAMSAKAASAITPPGKPSLSGDISVSEENYVGEDVSASLNLKNLTDKAKTMNLVLNIESKVYNGLKSNKIWNTSQQITIGPNAEQKVPVMVKYLQYKKPLTNDNIIKITAMCEVKDEPIVVVEKSVTLENPPVHIKALGQAVVGKNVTIEISFVNPLNDSVKDCMVTSEGSGLLDKPYTKSLPPMEPRQKATAHIEIKPTKSGTHQFLVNLTCDKFKDVKGFQSINVSAAQ